MPRFAKGCWLPVDKTYLVRFAAEISRNPPEIPEMPRRGLPVVVGHSSPHPNPSMPSFLLASSSLMSLLIPPRFAICSAAAAATTPVETAVLLWHPGRLVPAAAAAAAGWSGETERKLRGDEERRGKNTPFLAVPEQQQDGAEDAFGLKL